MNNLIESVILLFLVFIGVIYIINMIRKAPPKRFEDFGKRFIAGIAGGLAVLLGNVLYNYPYGKETLDMDIMNVASIIAIFFIIIAFCLLLFDMLEYQSEHRRPKK